MNYRDKNTAVILRFIALDRWKALFGELKNQSRQDFDQRLGISAIINAVLISTIPIIFVFLDTYNTRKTAMHLPTIAFGTCAVMAIWLKWRYKLSHLASTKNYKELLSLTHTAVAAGCIPAVLLMVFAPELLTQRRELVTAAASPLASDAPLSIWALLSSVIIVVLIAAWVAITEETIFRGLLISVIRRANFFAKQSTNDLMAVTLSAMLFGLAHYPTWGIIPTIAMLGLGIGFGIAYIASGERLIFVMIYHFLFDSLSILVSLLI
ncbi:MAG: CPBP family intramembrane metalloprotease [Deltaproteobacteria bacterium]|nr:CPBP family intramembrane metalloprotease [Deltaproteobacteria bacterium]